MNTAILLIGGNLGNRTENLRNAATLIAQKAGEVVQRSAFYQTAPWGHVQQPDYLNQALEIRTELEALPLLQTLLGIEEELGRIRRHKWGARVIDIDMIFYNDAIISLPDLKIPHPRMHLRNFVLTPLMDIVPDYMHPVMHQTVRELYADSQDQLPAEKYTD